MKVKYKKVKLLTVVCFTIFQCLGCSPSVASNTYEPPQTGYIQKNGGFEDIEDHWAKQAIERLVESGIVSGIDEHHFAPDQSVTREQFVSLLMRTMKLPVVSDQAPFSDIPSSRWSASYIAGAIKAGVIDPQYYYEDGGFFAPEQPIPREEMAVMIWRALRMTDHMNNINIKFKDEQEISAEDVERIDAVAAAGILSGNPDGTFKPNATLTRTEACIVLTHILDFIDYRSKITITKDFYPNPNWKTYYYSRGNWRTGAYYESVSENAKDKLGGPKLGAKFGDTWQDGGKSYTFVALEKWNDLGEDKDKSIWIDVILIEESNPSDGSKTLLKYARGVGFVYSEVLESKDHKDDGRYWSFVGVDKN